MPAIAKVPSETKIIARGSSIFTVPATMENLKLAPDNVEISYAESVSSVEAL